MFATMAADVSIRTQPTDAEARTAVSQRDARYDGRFVYGVASTKIFCRPSCPSRRPTKSAIEIFASPPDAERAGYRACLRCKPADASGDSADNAIARARAYLDAHTDAPVTLATLAKHAGLSPFHLQRSFKTRLGVSPREYHAALRANRLKTRLRAGDTVSRATYEAGFGSSSRVYENADDLLGMTPASYKRGGAGTRIAFAIAATPVGRVLVATTERGVCAVTLGESDAQLERALRADFPKAEIVAADVRAREWIRAVIERVKHPRASTTRIPLDVVGTAFQWRVWKALQEIPFGATRSYTEVAESIGRPSAARAVARACASNRVAVVIPCHRVVRGDGELGGYRWGIERKDRILGREAGDD